MRKIILHGALGKKYGKVFNLDVRTAGEAIRALSVNFSEFRKDISDGSWHVVRGKNLKEGRSLDEAEVAGFNLGKGDLHIIPEVKGAKRGGGILKVILGVALIGAAFMFTGGALSAAVGSGMFASVTGTQVAIFGLGLALAGVSSMLSPESKSKDGNNKENSFITSGPSSTSDQGIPVPLIYGEIITGAGLVSGGIDIQRLNPQTGQAY